MSFCLATRLAEQGIMEEIIDRVLNHSRRGVIRVYNHYAYDKEIRGALEAWERKLTGIVNGKGSGKVIPIQSSLRRTTKTVDTVLE